MNEVMKFMEALQNDPGAKTLMDSIDVPDDDEKGIDVYLDLAKKLGFSISRDDLLSWKEEKEKECRARAEKAEACMAKELDPEQMGMAAGGKKGDPACDSTFHKGEWCWFTDSCKHVINRYHCLSKSD